MLIVTEHQRDAKEGKYGAGDSLKCKSEPTDHHMLNEGNTFGFYWVPNSILIHEFIHTIRLLLSLFLLPTLRQNLKYLGTQSSVTEHSASAVEEIYSQKRLCSCFDTAEDVQFASVNQKIRTPEGRDWAGDRMSLEPH